MRSSIPQATVVTRASDRTPSGRTPAEVERDDLRALLFAVREALDLPHGPQRDAYLSARASLVCGALRDVLTDTTVLGIVWETDLLRRMVREHGGSHA
ncbi:hypothetical protein ACFYRN_25270 [Streptomyces sp. NPDC005227]|uniref:hypothetical protein n=1 Tax=Streptomyces sp. NPDC005227 TaxID=3364707 RepID=UPI0036756B00